MKKLHLATNKEVTYMTYLSVMSAIRKNKVVFWYVDEPEGKWWDLIVKMAIKSPSLEIKPTDPLTGITIDGEAGDDTGRIDILYMAEFDRKQSIDEAFINHFVIEQPIDGEFGSPDLTLIRVFPPEGEDNLDFITPEWVSANNNLLTAFIKRYFLERVWNPYGYKKI